MTLGSAPVAADGEPGVQRAPVLWTVRPFVLQCAWGRAPAATNSAPAPAAPAITIAFRLNISPPLAAPHPSAACREGEIHRSRIAP